MMLLKDLINASNEVEVWDDAVDIANPVYFIDGEQTWDECEEHHLFLLEKWLLGLEVTHVNRDSCCVNCFETVKKRLEDCYKANDFETLATFQEMYDEDFTDDDEIALFVEDIFTCLSQGYHNLSKRFCMLLGIKEVDE